MGRTTRKQLGSNSEVDGFRVQFRDGSSSNEFVQFRRFNSLICHPEKNCYKTKQFFGKLVCGGGSIALELIEPLNRRNNRSFLALLLRSNDQSLVESFPHISDASKAFKFWLSGKAARDCDSLQRIEVPRAMACNGQRQTWHVWHRGQRGICKLQSSGGSHEFESLRPSQCRINRLRAKDKNCVRRACPRI
jgi:hypothetical protein